MTNYNMSAIRKRKYKKKVKGLPCGICGQSISGLITIDHKIPISKGGSNKQDNLQPAHFLCNIRKGNNVL